VILPIINQIQNIKKKKAGTGHGGTVDLSSGIAVGLTKGFRGVKKRKTTVRPSYTKGIRGKRTVLVKEIIREVAGQAPYEKRLAELLRNKLEKRALKLAKKKVGTHGRAKKRR